MEKNTSGIWVTGASSGIGKETAKEFARIGCKVFASARRVTELERLQKELKKEKLSITILPCNVASSTNVDQTVKKILGEYKIDCLVNNAGISSFKLAEENSVTEIKDIVNANLLGSIYAIKSVLPSMIKQESGTIINLLSVTTKKIFLKSSVYAASKAGLKAYSDVLREEVRNYNIRVINVTPGATETPIWTQDMRKKYGERMMSPEEIARLIVWAYLQKGNAVIEELLVRPAQGDL